MFPPEVAARVARRPRLLAHLTLVHEAAEALLKGLRARWPELQLDEEAVLFGAATHLAEDAPARLVWQAQHPVD